MNEMNEIYQNNNEHRGIKLHSKSIVKPKQSITPCTTSHSIIIDHHESIIHTEPQDFETTPHSKVEVIHPIKQRSKKKNETLQPKNIKISTQENFLQHFNDNYEDLIRAIMLSNKKSVSLKSNDMPRVFMNTYESQAEVKQENKKKTKTGIKDKKSNKVPLRSDKPKLTQTIVAQFISQANNKNEEEQMKGMTNTQEISDFYEYTEECMKRIRKLKVTPIGELKDMFITLPFEKEISRNKKRLAIFDLDETLVHCVVKKNKPSQHMIQINLPTKGVATVGLNVRPLWKEALQEIKKNYFIIVYTASHQSYADSVIDFLDPDKDLIEYRLYRHNCVKVQTEGGESIYVKDLRIFKNISLKDMIIIDNSVLSFAFHLENGIPIVPYYENSTDAELKFLSYFLNEVARSPDLREENKKNMRLDYFYQKAGTEEFEESKEDVSIERSGEEKVSDGSESKITLNLCDSGETEAKVVSEDSNELKRSPTSFVRQSSKRVTVFQGELMNTMNEMKKNFTKNAFIQLSSKDK